MEILREGCLLSSSEHRWIYPTYSIPNAENSSRGILIVLLLKI